MQAGCLHDIKQAIDAGFDVIIAQVARSLAYPQSLLSSLFLSYSLPPPPTLSHP